MLRKDTNFFGTTAVLVAGCFTLDATAQNRSQPVPQGPARSVAPPGRPPAPPAVRQPPPAFELHMRKPTTPRNGRAFGAERRLSRPAIFPNLVFSIDPRKDSEEACPTFIQIIDRPLQVSDASAPQYSGEAPLLWLANAFALKRVTAKRAVWEGRLFSEYQGCFGRADLESRDGNPVSPHEARFAMQFKGTTVALVMETKPHIATIADASIGESGRPEWRWIKRMR